MRKFLLLALLLPSLAFGHGAPVIWNGTSAKWLPSGLQSAGVCKLSAAGVMSSSTVGDTELTEDYILADGSRGLTSNWNAGAHNITASTFIGSLTGNASTSTALASNPSDCGAGTKATSIDASGNLTCSAVSLTADVSGTLPVANGGTGTSTQFTVGSVIFAGSSGVYSQDNSNLFFDDSNNRLGVGTPSPTYRLHLEADADDYTHGMAIANSDAGSANALWNLYTDRDGPFTIRNPNQSVAPLNLSHLGNVSLASGALNTGRTLNLKNITGETGDISVAITKIGSQTANLLSIFDTDDSTVLASVNSSGAGTFAGMTVSTLGTGVVHSNGSGVFSSSAVNLAGGSSEVTGTLPVANGGTGASSLTANGVLLGNGTSAVSALAPTTPGAILSANGSGAAPIYTTATYPHTVTSGSVMVSTVTNVWKALSPGTDGQVLTMSGAAPTWAANSPSYTLHRSVAVGGNGRGTVGGDKIRRFDSITNTGTCVTGADDAGNGATFTIESGCDGVYAITYCDYDGTGSNQLGITVNASSLSSSVTSYEYSTGLRAVSRIHSSGGQGCVAATDYFVADDVIRAHTSGTMSGTNATDTTFIIIRTH